MIRVQNIVRSARALCTLAGLLLLAVGCTHKPGASQPVTPSTPVAVAAITTLKPAKKTLQRLIDQPGYVEAFEETPLVARLPGYIQKINVDMGDRIQGPRYDKAGKPDKPGQVLAELSVPEMDEELKQKQALVVQAEAVVGQAQAALDAAEARIVTAKAAIREAEAGKLRAQATFERWETEQRRMDKLVLEKVIDKQTRDEVRNQYLAADAGRQESEAKVQSTIALARESEAQRDKARADLAAAKANVQVAQAEAGRVAALVEYSKIRAPYDGIVTRRNINTGTYVQPDAGKSMPALFTVARLDTIRVFVDVPEIDAGYVRDGAPADARFQALHNRTIAGTVTRTSGALDPRSRTLRVEMDLPNPQGELRSGMYAYVRITASLPDRWVLPAATVLYDGEQPYAFQLQQGRAVRTPLRLGLRDGAQVELLEKQVRPANSNQSPKWEAIAGDEVFLQGNLAGVKDGDEVKLSAP
jgi:multidrug efflux pump subunit AcrA (membrane-fusion protein)